ncbi:MAG: hypothetical protein ABW158_05570 [Candidatus Thiodiazotropha sp. 6PDIVS]
MLRIGFFSNFKGADTVLIAGNSEDIQSLSRALAEVATGGMLPLHETANVSKKYPVTMFASTVSPGNRAYWWKCTDMEIDEINGMLDPLTRGENGHHYFNLEGTDVQLIVSVGEYSSNRWQEYG